MILSSERIHDLAMLYLKKQPDIDKLTPSELVEKYLEVQKEMSSVHEIDINKIIKERAESGKSIL